MPTIADNKIILGTMSALWMVTMAMGAFIVSSFDTRIAKLEDNQVEIRLMLRGNDIPVNYKPTRHKSVDEYLQELNEKVDKLREEK